MPEPMTIEQWFADTLGEDCKKTELSAWERALWHGAQIQMRGRAAKVAKSWGTSQYMVDEIETLEIE